MRWTTASSQGKAQTTTAYEEEEEDVNGEGDRHQEADSPMSASAGPADTLSKAVRPSVVFDIVDGRHVSSAARDQQLLPAQRRLLQKRRAGVSLAARQQRREFDNHEGNDDDDDGPHLTHADRPLASQGQPTRGASRVHEGVGRSRRTSAGTTPPSDQQQQQSRVAKSHQALDADIRAIFDRVLREDVALLTESPSAVFLRAERHRRKVDAFQNRGADKRR